MKKNKEESEAQRLFRDYLMDNYDEQGPQHRMIMLSTLELIYKFRNTADIGLEEAIETLHYLGFRPHDDSSGQTKWLLFERHDPIDNWR